MSAAPERPTARDLQDWLRELAAGGAPVAQAGSWRDLAPEYLWAYLAGRHQPDGRGRCAAARCGQVHPCETRQRLIGLLEASARIAADIT